MTLAGTGFIDRVIGWNVTVSLRGAYTATIQLANKDQAFTTATFLGKPIMIHLDTDSLASSGIDSSCFQGNLRWIYGIVKSAEQQEGVSVSTMNLQVVSFASRLAKKPINTKVYDSTTTIDSVLGDIVNTFGGLPTALYNFEATNFTTCTAISGDNMLDEAKKVAQAAKQVLFVNRNGMLVTESWRDNSTIDVQLPPEAIKSASRTVPLTQQASFINVRGCWISGIKKGKTEQNSKRGGSKNRGKKGKLIKCFSLAVPVPVLIVPIGNLPNGAVESGEVTVESPGAFSDSPGRDVALAMENAENRAYIEVSPDGTQGSDTTDGFDGTDREVEIGYTAYDEHPEEYESPDATIANPKDKKDDAALINMFRRFNPRVGGGGQASLIAPKETLTKTKEEVIEFQRQQVVKDTDLMADVGVVWDEFSNLYVDQPETLFDIGVRKFVDDKMSRKAWTVELVYVTCIDVNDVIKFTVPESLEVVTGLVTDIQLTYQGAGPSAQMTMTVESFEDTGSTLYQSENILKDPIPISTGSADWTVSTGGGEVRFRKGDPHKFVRTTSGTTYIEQDLLMEVGVPFVASAWVNSGTLTIEIRDSGGVHSTVSGTGQIDHSFTPDEEATTVRYTYTGSSTIIFQNMKLVKFKTA